MMSPEPVLDQARASGSQMTPATTTTSSHERGSSPDTTPSNASASRKPAPLLGAVLHEPYIWQVLLAGSFLAVWQWLPAVPGISEVLVWADPFFISSPVRVANQLYRLFVGANNTPLIWEPLSRTLFTAMAGAALGTVVGAVGGLVCSHWELLSRIVRPFVTVMNSVPKVALIPIIVLVAGSSGLSSVITAFIVVIFFVFYNAYEGGRTVPSEMMESVTLLGAGQVDQLFRVRWPFVLAWTFSQLPNVIAHGLLGTITGELFTGASGIGQLLIRAVNTANADLTFALVVVIGTTGVLLVFAADAVRHRVLHWWVA